MTILSIQSAVAYGHVGNSAAVFPLQRLGFHVWPVNTVQFSNHLGYGSARGPVHSAADVAAVIEGVEERGVFPDCRAVLSGYMGDLTIGEVILDAAARVKRASPSALYCCDPVMGDVGGFYVRPGIPEFMRHRAVPAADLITPNQFELEYLTGAPVGTLAEALAACDLALALGPKVVLLTSLRRADGPAERIEMLAVAAGGAWLVATPHYPITVNGSGDVTAALFLAGMLDGGDVAAALARTAAAIHAVMAATHAAGSREIALIPAQGELVRPSRTFAVEQVR